MADSRPLSVSEREGLREEQRDLEGQLSRREGSDTGIDYRGDKLQQPQLVRDRLRQIQTHLSNDPGRAAGRERVQIERRLREIEPSLRRGLVSDQAQRMKTDAPGYEQVVRAQQQMLQRSGEYREWQGLRRRLDPSDPGVSSVDRHLRPRS